MFDCCSLIFCILFTVSHDLCNKLSTISIPNSGIYIMIELQLDYFADYFLVEYALQFH